MHPSIPTPQSPCRANAVPVAIAVALAPAAGVCVAGVSYREAVSRKRGPTFAGVRAGSAGTRGGNTRQSLSFTPPILTPEEPRVNT